MRGPDLTDSPILRFWFLVPDDDSDEGQCCCLPAVHHTCGSSVSIGFFFGSDRDGDAAECTRKELSILMHLLSCCVVRLSCSGLSSCCLWRFSSFSIICLDFGGLSMDNPPKAYDPYHPWFGVLIAGALRQIMIAFLLNQVLSATYLLDEHHGCGFSRFGWNFPPLKTSLWNDFPLLGCAGRFF